MPKLAKTKAGEVLSSAALAGMRRTYTGSMWGSGGISTVSAQMRQARADVLRLLDEVERLQRVGPPLAPEPEPAQVGLFADELLPGEYVVPSDGKSLGTCRSCGAAIAWTRSEAGKAVPLSLAKVRTVGGQRVAVAHFTDCPDGRDWRKK